MKVARSLGELRCEKNSVVTVGTFDGIHRAHREIVREVLNRTRTREGRSVVVTFDPHPKEVVRSRKGPVALLTTMEERIALLEELSIDLLFIIPFTLEFSRIGSRDFYLTYVVNGVGVSEVVVGYDHSFGRDREAGIEQLVRIGKEFDFSVFAVHPYTVEGETVSSTLIRRALAAGEIARARKFLGYDYTLRGKVVRGDGRGGPLFGYPTANIRPLSDRKVIPGRGVYLVAVGVGGERCFGMLNIGVRPTVTDGTLQVIEVHIFDFSRDIYDETLDVSFMMKIRDERKFGSVGELAEQLAKDKEVSLKYVRELENKK